jgi:hypothetical protein
MKTSGTEDPEINPHMFANLIFDSHHKHMTGSSTNVVGKPGYLPAEN